MQSDKPKSNYELQTAEKPPPVSMQVFTNVPKTLSDKLHNHGIRTQTGLNS